jgi:glutamyl-tRNA(Gln) amidotransferase subunit E
MFGFEPYSGIRLGKEIGQLVRFFGIGGVFHSDELPNYGINDSDVGKVRKHLELTDGDGFLIIAGEDSKLDYAIDSIIKRIQDAVNGVPAETRAATQDGETVFLRPRPGASRMYPETDIPSISVMPEEVKLARENIPKSWDDSIAEIQQKYDLNFQLSEQIFDSEYMEMFEKICENKKNSPNFVASILCSSITNLERKGLDAMLLKPEHIIESFELLASGKIPKESLEIIFESIMSGKSENVSIAMQSTDVSSMDEAELNRILDKIIQNNMDLVKERGEHAVVTLMGIAMKEVRGKASGKMVNDLLRKKVSEL